MAVIASPGLDRGSRVVQAATGKTTRPECDPGGGHRLQDCGPRRFARGRTRRSATRTDGISTGTRSPKERANDFRGPLRIDGARAGCKGIR